MVVWLPQAHLVLTAVRVVMVVGLVIVVEVVVVVVPVMAVEVVRTLGEQVKQVDVSEAWGVEPEGHHFVEDGPWKTVSDE